ncbi:MAG: hypothetical protein SH819_13145 [Cytophagales bacterium]|nr:hypothetical protein [Cytophagales bacterium]
MEQITNTQEDSLLDFLDGKLEGHGLQQLKSELETSAILRERLEELRIVHQALVRNRLESPSSSFVDRVMAGLRRKPASVYASPKNGILLILGVLVAAGLLITMVSAGFFDSFNGIISMEQIAPTRKYLQWAAPSIPINAKLIMKTLVGLNLLIAFIVLDRTVLRPYFQRRQSQGS